MVTYVSDTFTRTVTTGDGFGTPDVGPAYTYSATGSSLTGVGVNGSEGVISRSSGSAYIRSAIDPVTDVQMTVEFWADQLATPDTANISARFGLREQVGSATDYHARMWIYGSGEMRFNFAARDIALVGSTMVYPEAYVPGTKYTLKAETYGVFPTQLRLKVWKSSDPEPDAWWIDRTDNRDVVQLAGTPFIYVTAGSSPSNNPQTLRVDNLLVRDSTAPFIPKVRYIGVNNFGTNYLTVGTILETGVTAAEAILYYGETEIGSQEFTLDGTTKWGYAHFTGLSPNREYRILPVVDGVEEPEHEITIKTLPSGVSSYTFVTGSCQFTASNHPVFDRIREKNPIFMAHQGDLHYGDATTENAWRTAHESSLTAARFSSLASTVPINWTMDNHDRIITNPTGGGTGLNLGETDPATAVNWKKLAGSAGWSTSDTIGRTWVAGRVRYITTDMWSVRDDGDGDPAPRTFLGAAQKAWFKGILDAAQEPVIVWMCQWTARNNANGRWNSFPEETTELETFINDRPELKARMVIIGGDSHSLQADNGSRTGTGYRFNGIPSLNISGFNRAVTEGDGSGGWSIANSATLLSGTESEWGNYSKVTITDNGETIDFDWDGVSVNNAGTESVLATFSHTFDAPSLSYALPLPGVSRIVGGSTPVSRIYSKGLLTWDQSSDVYTDVFPFDEGHTESHAAAASSLNEDETRVVELEKRSSIVVLSSLFDIPAGTKVGTTLVIR